MTKLHKDKNHDHYWIQDCVLYESYRTIRGLRYRALMEVPAEDTERLTESEIKYIEENYLMYQ